MLKDAIFAWHATLVAGKYQLVLDIDEYGLGVYSEIPGYAESVYDPLWTFTVVQVNQPPDVSEADPCIVCLWPPNHMFADITIEGVTDPDGDAVTITITGNQ